MYGDFVIWSSRKWGFKGYRNIYDYWHTEMHGWEGDEFRDTVTEGLKLRIEEFNPDWKAFTVRFEQDKPYSKTVIMPTK